MTSMVDRLGAKVDQERVPIGIPTENEAESEPDQNNFGSSHKLSSKYSSSYRRSRLSCLPVSAIFSRSKNSKSLENSQNTIPRKPTPPTSSMAGPAQTRPQARVSFPPSRPPANLNSRASGTTENTEGSLSKTSPLHLLTMPPRLPNAGPSHEHEGSHSKKPSFDPSWRTSHPLSSSGPSSPKQILFPPSSQPQGLMPEKLADSPLSPQRGTGNAGFSPRSASQPISQLAKSSAELQLHGPRSPVASPQGSPLDSPIVAARGRSISLAPPPSLVDLGGSLAAPQSPVSDPPMPALHLEGGNTGPETTGRWRKTWIPGSRSRQASQDISGQSNGPGAWYFGEPNREYNAPLLLNAQRIPELWHENGDTYVYLLPLTTGRGPSFRIPSFSFSSSPKLMSLAFGEQKARPRARSFEGRNSLSAIDATRKLSIITSPHMPRTSSNESMSPVDGFVESISSLGDSSKEGHLNFPFPVSSSLQSQDESIREQLEYLITVRNLFAFLMLQPLVSTRKHPTIFSILLEVARHLAILGFSNVDGSTYGEAVSTSLKYYIENLGLADVRDSREKALEAIVLGEQLRSVDLYTEGFSHVVGRYESTREMKFTVWDMISPNTHNRMELAFMDLRQRQNSVQLRLTDFEFPSMFAGIAASTSTAESKAVRFKAWRSSFSTIRKFTLSYYKDLHGSWPPRAKDKRNNFMESGLNRLVLQGLYRDFCMLYDLLVDRESLTTRSMDANDAFPVGEQDIAITALRKVFSEFDHSSPPIQPPVPFDAPKVPTVLTVQPKNNDYPLKLRLQNETRKLQPFECILILTKSHNLDSDFKSPFVQAFCELEGKEGRGRSAQDLVDQRFGCWLFMYAVLQSLPMLVIDAPGLRHTEGVEYFLCEPAKGGLPWMEDSPSARRAWYGVANGTGVVALPSDVVQHGVEGVYRRSHCWKVAEKWLAQGYGPLVREEHRDDHDYQSTVEDEQGTQSTQSDIQTHVSEPEVLRPRHRSPAPELSVVTEEAQFSTRRQGNATSLHPQSAHPNHRRSRTISPSQRQRRSVAFPLEQLPLPPGYNMSPKAGPMPSPPIGTGLLNGQRGSEDNTPVMLSPETAFSSSGTRAKNFDEILGEMGRGKEREKEKGRMSFIGF